MATLTTPLFGRVDDTSSDEEQLLKLFWNRAELKKELATLRRESVLAGEKLKQQEAITLRVQQQLEELESRLGDPGSASGAVTYYQLQGVWNACRSKLLAMSAEMERAQHNKQYRQHVAVFRRSLKASLTGIQQALNEVNSSGDLLSDEIRQLRELRSKSRGFWNILRRRRLTAEIEAKRLDRRAITMRLGELTEEVQSRSSEDPPEFEGLDTASKRAINLKILAYAQELYVHFADRNVAGLAREASIRKLKDLSLGGRRECRAVRAHIEERMLQLDADKGISERAQLRVRHLHAELQYRRDSDTVPIAGVLGGIALLKADGTQTGSIAVNLLGDEYWDVFAALLI